jgi:hypothetical protein
MTTTDKISYQAASGVPTSITCTINSLANSATVGRQSTVIDNSSNLYVDALVLVSITNPSSGQASPNSVYVYLFGSPDGTYYTQDDGAMGASDAAYTVNSPSNLKGPFAMYCPTASKVYNEMFSVASFFGGVMPYKWGIVVVNNTGATLASSGNLAEYTGIWYTNG